MRWEMGCTMSQSDIPSDTLYQVWADPDTNNIRVRCIGMNCVDNALEDSYDHWDALPEFIKGRVSVLMMVERGRKIEGVGMRKTNFVGADTFYLD